MTLIEVIVVVAISSVIMIIAYDLIEGAMRTSLFVESHNQLAQLSQRPINAMNVDAFQSKVIYQNDTAGQSFLAMVVAQLPASFPIQAGFRLPLANASTNMFAPDDSSAGVHYVGNCLLVLKQLNPLSIKWDNSVSGTGGTFVNFPADVYRFDFYYLSRNTKRSFGNAGYFVDLIRWRSVEYADYNQLSTFFAGSFVASQKNAIVSGLSAQGITIAVDASGSQPAASSFYTIGAGGTLTVIATPTIAKLADDKTKQIYGCQSILPELGTGSVSGKMLYSVGFIPASPATPFVLRDPIPKYAYSDTSLPGYVTGFENKIVGSGASQKTLLRLVLMSNYSASKFDSEEGFGIVSRQ
jgi:hypothetical protein